MTVLTILLCGAAAFWIGFRLGAGVMPTAAAKARPAVSEKEAESLRQWNNFLNYDGSEQTE